MGGVFSRQDSDAECFGAEQWAGGGNGEPPEHSTLLGSPGVWHWPFPSQSRMQTAGLKVQQSNFRSDLRKKKLLRCQSREAVGQELGEEGRLSSTGGVQGEGGQLHVGDDLGAAMSGCY